MIPVQRMIDNPTFSPAGPRRDAQRGIFITGTDTHVGKTQIGAALAHALSATLRRQGQILRVRKPVESAATTTADGLLAEDANTLRLAAGSSEPLQRICPYPLAAATSPQRAAELEGRSYSVAQLHHACMNSVNPQDFLLVEGAGGLLSPLCKDGLNADLAQHLGLPVLLVVADRLGCINHTLLTLEALAARDLKLQAIVLNRCQPLPANSVGSASELARHCPHPLTVMPASHQSPPWHGLPTGPLLEILADTGR